MSAELAKVVEFEGHRVTTALIDGRPAWIASEVGIALGYADGARLPDKITGEWSRGDDAELIAGTDFETITNGRLAALKARLSPESGESPIGARAPSVTILYESGLHLALLKTRKPAGRRLRRLLATEVLPKLVRGEAVAPSQESVAMAEARARRAAEKATLVEAAHEESMRDGLRMLNAAFGYFDHAGGLTAIVDRLTALRATMDTSDQEELRRLRLATRKLGGLTRLERIAEAIDATTKAAAPTEQPDADAEKRTRIHDVRSAAGKAGGIASGASRALASGRTPPGA